MTECSTETRNVVVEIKSKCYDSRPGDRYKMIYSYPPSEYGSLVSLAIGDSLYFSTGNSGFVSNPSSENTEFVRINFINDDIITASREAGVTTAPTLEYIPDGGISQTITVPSGPSTLSNQGTKTFQFSFSDPVLTIVVVDGSETVTIEINMTTNNIIVS